MLFRSTVHAREDLVATQQRLDLVSEEKLEQLCVQISSNPEPGPNGERADKDSLERLLMSKL